MYVLPYSQIVTVLNTIKHYLLDSVFETSEEANKVVENLLKRGDNKVMDYDALGIAEAIAFKRLGLSSLDTKERSNLRSIFTREKDGIKVSFLSVETRWRDHLSEDGSSYYVSYLEIRDFWFEQCQDGYQDTSDLNPLQPAF